MREKRSVRRILHEFFEITVVVKGVDGVLEAVLGFVILFFNRHIVRNFLLYFVQGELNEDPRDWLSNQLLHLWNHITPSSEFFTGAYFLVNGTVKIILVWGLLKGKLWSYPWALAILGAFMIYEIYRYFHTHSLILVALVAIDVVTIGLIADEWRARREANRRVAPDHARERAD